MDSENNKRHTLLYVGSLIKRKGIDLLLMALSRVSTDFVLRIVGNGTEDEIDSINSMAKKYGISDKIIICGFKENGELIQEYRNADLFVFPSREDCFGLVLLEALAANLPIICSKYADGSYDIIENYNNGIIVDPYDSSSFGSVINDVLTGKIHLNGSNKRILEKFTFENVSKGYLEAIDFVKNQKINNNICIITNMPSPYRLDLFCFLQKEYKNLNFTIIYTKENSNDRVWTIDKEKMNNSYILKSKSIKKRQGLETRTIDLPKGVFKILNKINANVVIAWEYNFAALSSLVWCKLHKKKYIHLTDGTLYSERNITRLQKFMRKAIIKRCDAAIASSSKSIEKLLSYGIPREKIFLSLLTVNIEKFNEV